LIFENIREGRGAWRGPERREKGTFLEEGMNQASEIKYRVKEKEEEALKE